MNIKYNPDMPRKHPAPPSYGVSSTGITCEVTSVSGEAPLL